MSTIRAEAEAEDSGLLSSLLTLRVMVRARAGRGRCANSAASGRDGPLAADCNGRYQLVNEPSFLWNSGRLSWVKG